MIKIVKEQNEEIRSLKYRISDKDDIIEDQDNQILFLKSKIEDLREALDYWKEKFHKILEYIHDKIFGIYEDEEMKTYHLMADNLYINDIIDEKEYNSVINKKERNRDDFER